MAVVKRGGLGCHKTDLAGLAEFEDWSASGTLRVLDLEPTDWKRRLSAGLSDEDASEDSAVDAGGRAVGVEDVHYGFGASGRARAQSAEARSAAEGQL